MTDQNTAHWEQRFKDTADLLPGIICEMDNDLQVTYANRFAYDSFKYTEADVAAGIFLSDLIHPDDIEQAKKSLQSIYSGTPVGPQEYRMVHKDGVVREYEVSSAARYEDGRLVGIRTCIFDISHRKQAQQHLKQSEERFRRMFDESPIGVALFASTGQLLEGNASFLKMFSVMKPGVSIWDVPALEALVRLEADQKQRLKSGEGIQCSGSLDMARIGETSEGPATRYLEWHISPFGATDDRGLMLLVQVADITEQKRAEQARIKEAERAAESARKLMESLRQEVREKFSFSNMVSRCVEMQKVFDLLPPIAQSGSTVLVTGESGTGKELIAKAIHSIGPRKRKPFVAINCSALPDTLLESELFGYKAGAFTDAKKDKAGKFAVAEGGILFLDEIGDISTAMQVKMLRVLQEKTYEPLGGIKSMKADVRIIAATHRDLPTLVQEGRFREDLYYRLNVVKITLPPLRARRSDIPLLCDHFIALLNRRYDKSIKGVSSPVLERLLVHDFKGNIRELENIIERAFIFCQSGEIGLAHLPEELRESSCDERGSALGAINSFEELEAQYLRAVLEETGGSRIKAAKRLGVHKSTLFRKLKKLGVQRD